MTEFRAISGLVLLLLLATIAYDLKSLLKTWDAVYTFLIDQARLVVNSWRGINETKAGKILLLLRSMVYSLTALLFLLLAMTGFLPILFLGKHLTGIMLVLHVTIAPLFALSLASLALLWAHRLRFDAADWRFLTGNRQPRSRNKDSLVRFALKTGFWLVLVFSLPLMLTVILELFPLFGTEGEEFLIRSHGYSALLLTLVALIDIYLTIAYTKHSNV